RNGSRPSNEGKHDSVLHILYIVISHAPAERAQQASFRLQTGAQGTFEVNISLNDLVHLHRSSPTSKAATSRRPGRSALAYVRVAYVLRWPRWSPISLS